MSKKQATQDAAASAAPAADAAAPAEVDAAAPAEVDAAAPAEVDAAAPAAVEVRALVDNPAHGLKAGELATIPAELVAPLKQAGAIDDHPDAVAYAKGL